MYMPSYASGRLLVFGLGVPVPSSPIALRFDPCPLDTDPGPMPSSPPADPELIAHRARSASSSVSSGGSVSSGSGRMSRNLCRACQVERYACMSVDVRVLHSRTARVQERYTEGVMRHVAAATHASLPFE